MSCKLRPLAMAISIAITGLNPMIGQAATYTVINTNDSGVGSLRQAILDANANAGADIITFSINSGSTISLSTGELVVTDSLTIKGPKAGDPNSITINANQLSRIINGSSLTNDTLVLENMTLTGGRTIGLFSKGGAVFVKNADVTLNHVFILGNSTIGDDSNGAGIHVENKSLILNHSSVSNNWTSGSDSNGSGISTYYADLTLYQSVVKNNNCLGVSVGGGIFASNGVVQVEQSTISGNSSIKEGGGLYLDESDVTFNNSIITDNFTTGSYAGGGGIYSKGGELLVKHSTVSDNNTVGERAYGGGIHSRFTELSIISSTISGNSTSGDYSKGGGIHFAHFGGGGMFHIYQSTISQNSTLGNNAGGGGIDISESNAVISQSTIVNNSSVSGAGGVSLPTINSGFYLELINSIFAKNTGPEGNLYNRFSFNSLIVSNSLFGDASAEINFTNTANIFTNSPDLGPLQDNGGSTFTHLPNSTSLAINKGSNTDIPSSTDQRGAGFTRILNGKVDIGAVEVPQPTSNYAVLKRAEIVRPILQAVHGETFIPPEASGTEYSDVSVGDFNADWIAQFKADGLTEGCAVDKFCPNSVVTKDELAKLIVKAKLGSTYNPMPATGIYDDVPKDSFNADWIEALNFEGDTTGCNTDPNKFCPKDTVTIEIFDNILNSAFP